MSRRLVSAHVMKNRKLMLQIIMFCKKIFNFNPKKIFQEHTFMSGSSHIQSVLIGVEYRNCRRTLDIYLLFAFWMGQIQLKLIYIFVTYGLASL